MNAPRTATLPSDAVTAIVTVLPALAVVLKARGIHPDAVFAEACVARPAEGSPLIRISVAELERIQLPEVSPDMRGDTGEGKVHA